MSRKEFTLEGGYTLIIDPYPITDLINIFHVLQRYYDPSTEPAEKNELFYDVLSTPNIHLAVPPDERLISTLNATVIAQELANKYSLVFTLFSKVVEYINEIGNGDQDKKK